MHTFGLIYLYLPNYPNLAPLLTLFGESVAKAYLSQSTHWLEHVIWASGPLGLLATVTSGIRVAGSKLLNAIIGHARRPRAEAEIELMRSVYIVFIGFKCTIADILKLYIHGRLRIVERNRARSCCWHTRYP